MSSSTSCVHPIRVQIVLLSLALFEEAIGALHLSNGQAATAEVLLACTSTTFYTMIANLGTSSLLARNSKTFSVQGFLPSNQWTLEVESWNQIILAEIQRGILEYATGPSDPEVLPYLLPPNGSYQERLCYNQRARSYQAQNFSVLAIVLILALGLLIICLNLGLNRLVGYIQRKKGLKDYRRLAWKSNGLLQVQRLAHEEAGFGAWDRCAQDVPITGRGETLALLDVKDPEHPVLLKVKSPVLPQQITYSTSEAPLNQGITHINNPQTTSTTGSANPPAENGPNRIVEIQEMGMHPFLTHRRRSTDSLFWIR